MGAPCRFFGQDSGPVRSPWPSPEAHLCAATSDPSQVSRAQRHSWRQSKIAPFRAVPGKLAWGDVLVGTHPRQIHHGQNVLGHCMGDRDHSCSSIVMETLDLESNHWDRVPTSHALSYLDSMQICHWGWSAYFYFRLHSHQIYKNFSDFLLCLPSPTHLACGPYLQGQLPLSPSEAA
ncbi:hypothetical protein EGW08_022366 [Elysia chlorotica]|uniref:Uncharacterized protein n=1 Tax=Elysia chlorotica TaxID=188477 RepID=A0A3S0Z9I2_ELYCH|nr:hypothetical protein EGW08_022366 [Elysia chlorotica]